MRVSHILQESGRGIIRNRAAFLLATSVQAVCLTLLTIFFVITLNLNAVVRAAGRRIEIHAFLTDDADPLPLQNRIGMLSGVADTRFVSRDSALAELRRDLGDDATLVDALDDNPLPASIRITLESGYGASNRLAEIERKIGLLPGVNEVWSGRESIARLDRMLRTAIGLGIAVLVIVALSITFIAFQTAETSILTRRHEIEIMELVGATRMTVRMPFMLEGTLQGLLGGLAAFLLNLLLVVVARAVLPAPVFPVGAVLIFTLLIGGFLGFLGSAIALNRID